MDDRFSIRNGGEILDWPLPIGYHDYSNIEVAIILFQSGLVV